MNESTRIYAAVSPQALWLRIEGRATAETCPALRTFCEARLSETRSVLCVVLTACEHFDSTFLGTMLCLQKLHGAVAGQSVQFVAPAESCHAALRRMGAHQLFPILPPTAIEPLDWTLIAASAADRQSAEFQRLVLDAHVELAAVPGPLGDLYAPIARMVEQEFDERQAASSRS